MLNPAEKMKIEKSLLKLFNLKGTYHTPEQLIALTDYICSKNYYYDTIIKGIQRLECEPLTTISNDRLEDSIKTAIPHNPNQTYYNCRFCEDMGIISMVDESGAGSALACPCGKSLPMSGQLVWNRQITQRNGKRLLTLANPGKLKSVS